MSTHNVQIANVIVIKNGVVYENRAIVAHYNGMCDNGHTLGDNLEREFWNTCRRYNPNLPTFDDFEKMDEDDPMLDEYPSLDDGYYEHDNICVCMSHATIL
jgi:hypothetical protein